MMQRYPVAYLRRSSADANDPGDVSREAQEQAVRALAARDGHNGELVTFVDWSRSASEDKSSRRTQYAAMVARIEAGEVSIVYAYAMDRLNRSLILSARFAKACEDHDVRIITQREGEVKQDTPSEWLRWTILATFGDYELRTIKVRAAGALAVRVARGDHIGRTPYGHRLAKDENGNLLRTEKGASYLVPDPNRPLEPVLAAVREAGSILGACKLLNARKVPVPHGASAERRHDSDHWHPTPLRRIVEREAADLLPKAGPSGRRTPARSSALAQLLVCSCGHTLTPEPTRSAYRCTRGNRIGREAHGPLWVKEAALLPWIMAEAARYPLPAAVEIAQDASGRRTALAAERAQATRLALVPGVDLAVVQGRLAEIDAALTEIDDEAVVEEVGPIDWDNTPPAALNAILRAYWREVRLDEQMRPVSAAWRIARMRA